MNGLCLVTESGISVSAETESHAERKIRLSAETEITQKVTIHFRSKTETETESSCDLSLYTRLQPSPSKKTIRRHTSLTSGPTDISLV